MVCETMLFFLYVIDEDGDVDMLLSNIDNSLRLYRNRAPKEGRHWLIVRALTGKRDALGALQRVEREAEPERFAQLQRELVGLDAENTFLGQPHMRHRFTE